MERWQNKIAVITGASSGIGAAIAKDLVLAGLQVVGLARRKEQIDDLKDALPVEKRSNLTAIYCDVSSLESVNSAFDDIITRFGGIDVLVNSAGCGVQGQLATMDVSDIQKVLQTNVMGVVHCTQRAFRSMKERNFDGHIITVNSIAGHTVFTGVPLQLPIANMYSPTKYALTAMSEIFRQEFQSLNTKIKISCISPGLVDTDILVKDLREAAGDCMLQPCDVSNAVVYMLSTPPHVLIKELMIKPVGELV